MSKIQITELDSQTSELKILNKAEIAEVLGGYRSIFRSYSWKFNAYISSKFKGHLTDIKPINDHGDIQLTVDGKKYSFTRQYGKNSKFSYVFVD